MEDYITKDEKENITQMLRGITTERNIIHIITDSVTTMSDNVNTGEVQWYKRLYSLRKLGTSNVFNIRPDINIVETEENKNIIKECSLDSDFYGSRKIKNYYALLAATNKNIICAAIDISGNLVFLTNTLAVVRKSVGDDGLEQLISGIADYAEKIFDVYHRSAGDDLLKSDMLVYLLNDLCIKLGSGYLDFENNIKRVGLIIDDSMKTLFRNERNEPSVYYRLINQNDMYRTVLGYLMKNQNELEEQAINKGIVIGSKFFTSFQRNGYIYDIGSGKWEKRLNLIPEFCIKHSTLYQIPPEYRRSHVEILTFDPATIINGDKFVLKASGSHPNVSSCGTICIGSDLSNKFSLLLRNRSNMINEYVNFIQEVEDALAIINYDSSYTSLDISTSDLIPVSTADLQLRRNQTSGLRRV